MGNFTPNLAPQPNMFGPLTKAFMFHIRKTVETDQKNIVHCTKTVQRSNIKMPLGRCFCTVLCLLLKPHCSSGKSEKETAFGPRDRSVRPPGSADTLARLWADQPCCQSKGRLPPASLVAAVWAHRGQRSVRKLFLLLMLGLIRDRGGSL